MLWKSTLILMKAAVERILFNLVDNACKYAWEGPDRAIDLLVEMEGEKVLIKVCDQGPGIATKDARRLFRPFTKLKHDSSRTAPGIGLGLSLSRRLARGMSGNLRLDQKRRKGTCFVLSLPLYPI